MASASKNVLVGVCSVKFDTTELGWTSDGVVITARTDTFNIKVEEISGTIRREIIDQAVAVTLNMAEGTLINMSQAIPGSSLAGQTLTLGGSALQIGKLVLVGKTPDGFARTITLTEVNPIGEVGIPYRKAAISIVPVTFEANVITADGTFGTIVDSTV